MAKKSTKETKKLIKIVYFDEVSATDYINIHNGGQIDWSTTENKERLAKLIAEIDAQAKSSFSFFSVIKASLSGQTNTSYDYKSNKVIESNLSNTILTDYINIANNDSNIHQFRDGIIFAPENSITLYKMYSSYLNLVPKEQMPIDIEQLNEALLGERGYYQMLLKQEHCSSVLRFNISAFKNNYTLADLSKMSLLYYGVKVGKCTVEQLSIDKEFELQNEANIQTPQEIINGQDSINKEEFLEIFDVVLAGVVSE